MWVGFLTRPFMILKSSNEGLSNVRSNFIFSPLKVGNWVTQTLPFFDKLRTKILITEEGTILILI